MITTLAKYQKESLTQMRQNLLTKMPSSDKRDFYWAYNLDCITSFSILIFETLASKPVEWRPFNTALVTVSAHWLPNEKDDFNEICIRVIQTGKASNPSNDKIALLRIDRFLGIQSKQVPPGMHGNYGVFRSALESLTQMFSCAGDNYCQGAPLLNPTTFRFADFTDSPKSCLSDFSIGFHPNPKSQQGKPVSVSVEGVKSLAPLYQAKISWSAKPFPKDDSTESKPEPQTKQKTRRSKKQVLARVLVEDPNKKSVNPQVFKNEAEMIQSLLKKAPDKLRHLKDSDWVIQNNFEEVQLVVIKPGNEIETFDLTLWHGEYLHAIFSSFYKEKKNGFNYLVYLSKIPGPRTTPYEDDLFLSLDGNRFKGFVAPKRKEKGWVKFDTKNKKDDSLMTLAYYSIALLMHNGESDDMDNFIKQHEVEKLYFLKDIFAPKPNFYPMVLSFEGRLAS